MNRVVLLTFVVITALGSGESAEDRQVDVAFNSEGQLAHLNLDPPPATSRRAREAENKAKKKKHEKRNGVKKAGKKDRKPNRKSGKGRTGKSNTKRKTKSRKKNRKKAGKGKRGKKNKKGRKKAKKTATKKNGGNKQKGKKSGTKPNLERQEANCTAALFKAGKEALMYANYGKMIKRMLVKGKLAKAKKVKAMTTFERAAAALQAATSNCTACVGNRTEQATAIKTCQTLANCSNSACDLCKAAELENNSQPGLEKLLDSCSASFTAWQDAYRIALRAEDCSRLENLPSVQSCLNTDWKQLEKDYMVLFFKCVKSSTAGSFGDCRKNERMAAYLSYECAGKCDEPSSIDVTTASSARRQRRLGQFSNLLNV